MEKEALKRIFDFIKNKDNKRHKKDETLEWKLLFNEPLTEKDLNVKGNLDLVRTKITSLPKGLKVGGWLDLQLSKITSLPEGLKVGLFLDLTESDIKSLPEGLKVGGHLFLDYTNINSLPKGLEVKRVIYAKHTNLNFYMIPKWVNAGAIVLTHKVLFNSNLIVDGALNLSGTYIQSLPEGLKIYGTLDIESSDIALLPKGLEVEGDLYTLNSSFYQYEYTDNQIREMIKPGFIKGKIFR